MDGVFTKNSKMMYSIVFVFDESNVRIRNQIAPPPADI